MRMKILLGVMAVLAMALVVAESPPAVVDHDSYLVKATDLVAEPTAPATGSVPDLDLVAIYDGSSDHDVGNAISPPNYAMNEQRTRAARLIPKEKVAASAPRASGASRRSLSLASNANATRVYRT